MNTSHHKPRTMTRSILTGAVIVGIASAGVWLLLTRGHSPATSIESAVRSVDRQNSAQSAPATKSVPRVLTNALENEAAPAATGPATVVPLPEPTPYSRQLVSALCRLHQANVPQTPEQIAEWKWNLQQLVAQGSPAVAAIREFLQKNVD